MKTFINCNETKKLVGTIQKMYEGAIVQNIHRLAM